MADEIARGKCRESCGDGHHARSAEEVQDGGHSIVAMAKSFGSSKCQEGNDGNF